MIVVIRISGLVGIDKNIESTLERLRLKRKYACVILPETSEIKGMLEKVRAYVAYGKIDKETLKLLILRRGRIAGSKPIDAKKISDAMITEIFESRRKLEDFGLKQFFRLHPPVKGFKKSTKQFYPRGMLGNHAEKVNELIMRML
jgi:large subunit ribosomal protein L30